MTTYINVTTSSNWARPPVGIVRVEVEIAKHLIAFYPAEQFIPCVWDGNAKKFRIIDTARYLVNLKSLELGLPKKDPRISKDFIEFWPSDTLLSIGLDWDLGFVDDISLIKKTRGINLVGCCYDIIPVLYPQYCVGDVASYFAQYFIGIAAIADHILCISHSSMRDLYEFLEEAGLPNIPPMSVFRLGDTVINTDTREITAPTFKHSISERGFILFVSTIERRKNHQAAYLALRKIIIDKLLQEEYIPTFIFVGMKGWGIDELLKDIELDPVTTGRILILSHVTDSELSWLYKNCLFTIFPSFYEGWGLPICESLAHGKPVICSNTSSMPEAGLEHARYFDPYSPKDLAEAIVEMLQRDLDREYYDIIHKYKPARWSDAAFCVLNVLKDVTNNSPKEKHAILPIGIQSVLKTENVHLSERGYISSPIFGKASRLFFKCRLESKLNYQIQIEIQGEDSKSLENLDLRLRIFHDMEILKEVILNRLFLKSNRSQRFFIALYASQPLMVSSGSSGEITVEFICQCSSKVIFSDIRVNILPMKRKAINLFQEKIVNAHNYVLGRHDMVNDNNTKSSLPLDLIDLIPPVLREM